MITADHNARRAGPRSRSSASDASRRRQSSWIFSGVGVRGDGTVVDSGTHFLRAHTFAAWQKAARERFATRSSRRNTIAWEELGRTEPALDLFDEVKRRPIRIAASRFRVPKKFLELAPIDRASSRRAALGPSLPAALATHSRRTEAARDCDRSGCRAGVRLAQVRAARHSQNARLRSLPRSRAGSGRNGSSPGSSRSITSSSRTRRSSSIVSPRCAGRF